MGEKPLETTGIGKRLKKLEQRKVKLFQNGWNMGFREDGTHF